MKSTIFAIGLILGSVSLASAQAVTKAKTSPNDVQEPKSAPMKQGGASTGTSTEGMAAVSATLQSTLDAKKASVGDPVLFRTTRSVKQGKTVLIEKGSTVMGRITEVVRSKGSQAGSRLAVVIDRLKGSDGTISPISAMIVSVTEARGSLATDDANADLFATSSTRSSTSGSNSGGLLGGTGGTVGGVLNTAAQTTGGALNTATSTVSNATGSLSSTASGTVRGLSISQSSSASAGGGSVLSASNGNVRIEKGATFNLAIAQSVSATKQ